MPQRNSGKKNFTLGRVSPQTWEFFFLIYFGGIQVFLSYPCWLNISSQKNPEIISKSQEHFSPFVNEL